MLICKAGDGGLLMGITDETIKRLKLMGGLVIKKEATGFPVDILLVYAPDDGKLANAFGFETVGEVKVIYADESMTNLVKYECLEKKLEDVVKAGGQSAMENEIKAEMDKLWFALTADEVRAFIEKKEKERDGRSSEG